LVGALERGCEEGRVAAESGEEVSKVGVFGGEGEVGGREGGMLCGEGGEGGGVGLKGGLEGGG
jgi:hypothetical protein